MRNKKLNYFLLIHLALFSIYNLGHPVTPQHIQNLNGPVYLTGLLLATMSLAQFLFSPLWGQLSDVLGRKVAFIGPIGYAFGQLGFILFDNVTLIIIFRFIAGAASIATTAHFAYLADHSSNRERVTYLGAAALIGPIAIFFGYSLGGYIGDLYGPRMSFAVQIVLSLIMALVIYLYMDDFKKVSDLKAKIQFNLLKQQTENFKRSNTYTRKILLLTFLNIISYQLVISQTAVILNNEFEKTMSYTGLFIALFNLIGGLASFFIQRKIFAKGSNTYRILPYLSLFSVFASFFALSVFFFSPIMLWFGLMFATLINTIFIALIQDSIIKVSHKDESGSALGANQGVQALGAFVGSMSAGFFFSSYYLLPILIGSLMFTITFIINKIIVVKSIANIKSTN